VQRLWLRVAFATALVGVLVAPAIATANPFVVERSIMGFNPDFPTLLAPDISGDTIVYGLEPTLGARTVPVFSLARGDVTSILSSSPWDITAQSVSGDWVVYSANSDIRARNIKTGTSKGVTTDAATLWDGLPAVSTADGAYVVWSRFSGGQYDVLGRNLGISGSPFTVAGGTGNQTFPVIHGKHVAYIDGASGTDTVFVKTIGSAAEPVRLTTDGHAQAVPDIGDHLVVWLAYNTSGWYFIRYYDFNTGLVYDGPSSTQQSMLNPQVSGDRILYNVFNGANQDLYVYDTRIAKTDAVGASFVIAATTNEDRFGRIDGNQLTYMTGNIVYFARLVVPSISLSAVPGRIPHGGHIHLKGSISDQGHRIAGATIGIERYGSGKWTRIKTLTATSTGTFSYQTPKNYTKTKYRVVYDGKVDHFGAPSANHLSAVSAVKTAWPR